MAKRSTGTKKGRARGPKKPRTSRASTRTSASRRRAAPKQARMPSRKAAARAARKAAPPSGKSRVQPVRKTAPKSRTSSVKKVRKSAKSPSQAASHARPKRTQVRRRPTAATPAAARPARRAVRPAPKAAAAPRRTRKAPPPSSITRPSATPPAAPTTQAKAFPRPAAKRARRPARVAPGLDRERRRVPDDDYSWSPPSSEELDQSATVRTGRHDLQEKYEEHGGTGSVIAGGDVDADWESASSVGDEAPGGDNPTPDQDIVDEIGRALGVEYDDAEELEGEPKITARDRHRWELDPASSDDWEDR